MSTRDDLMAAFAGESQANRKYLAFAKKAKEDGFSQVARLFRAAAEAETVHALNHLRVLKGIGSTEQNLGEAISGETHEFTDMYPGMISKAEEENNAAAKRSFTFANKVEEIHARMYQNALKSVEAGKDLEEKEISVCPVCGNTFDGNAPDTCPICGTPKARFILVE